jgi:aldose sugar dehydrogenase
MKISFLRTVSKLRLAGVSMGLALVACTPSATNLPPAAEPATGSPESTAVGTNAPSGFQQTILVNGLDRPWGMAWLPDGTMLITEKAGQLRRVSNGVLESEPIGGVPAVMAQGQGGLLDIALHPRFVENRWVYLTYAHGTPSENWTRVARAKLAANGKALEDLQVIFEVSQPKSGTQHFGSRLLWLPDETLLVSFGDGGNPPVSLEGELIRQQAQNLRSRLGKIVRLNEDGSMPSDNPFVGRADVEPAVWSYGHRNIQGLAWDAQTQQVWATEHGSRGGDELNAVEAGQNYGWPLVTHSREYTGGEISEVRSQAGMVDPLVVWTPAIAPSGLVVYRGDRFPLWQGDVFAGGLVAESIQRVDVDERGAIVGQEVIGVGQRVRDVRQGPDGLLYVLTDDANGRLIRLEPSR